MERQITFNTNLFGGFNKKSVLKYIDDLCGQNEVTVQELTTKITEMQTRSEGFTGTITQLGSELEAMRATTAQRSEQEVTMEQTIKELNTEIDRQQRLVEDKEREIKIQQEKCRQLLLRAESLEYKGRKYDESMALIGGAIIEAQRSAEGIIKAAENKASRLTVTTMESIQSLAGEIRTFKGDITMLRSTLQQSMSDLEQRLDSIDSSLDNLDAAVKTTGVVKDDAEQEPEEKAYIYKGRYVSADTDISELEAIDDIEEDNDQPYDFFNNLSSNNSSDDSTEEKATFGNTMCAEPMPQPVKTSSEQQEAKPAAKPREFFW